MNSLRCLLPATLALILGAATGWAETSTVTIPAGYTPVLDSSGRIQAPRTGGLPAGVNLRGTFLVQNSETGQVELFDPSTNSLVTSGGVGTDASGNTFTLQGVFGGASTGATGLSIQVTPPGGGPPVRIIFRSRPAPTFSYAGGDPPTGSEGEGGPPNQEAGPPPGGGPPSQGGGPPGGDPLTDSILGEVSSGGSSQGGSTDQDAYNGS